ncbi:50S ribosomal protein L22 [Candidatus Woesebacteria bacterium RBG_16_36_11]|uniref:Large ribosomal subunit protein uL22 n=3 Tax=Candidatus Woeseibacteriota TaxID=1752722 RepID=A0A1F7XBE9_9BACT|nr:MAG: 50S ribosomal protein L22 [Candidatus Woesebacteria bacterium RBG_13_36_22]OGM12341.1 MAG: 50S ribosomal protein L22 [Candidatus Woesebacteria bacterium RBG_16_36_11]OGM17240.1 MAG: 50S ribosomal protein L22 [Candidatus Woesebacteria bacterium RBG_19FT_COMBO_37_29]
MEIISTQKYVRLSPRKIRPVVVMIKKLTPVRAVEVLPFIDKNASEPLRKVIQTAIANAKDRGIADNDLFFKEIRIGEGPRLKRGRAISRGRWHPIKKRMSHIRVILATKSDKTKDTKIQKNAVKEVKQEEKGKTLKKEDLQQAKKEEVSKK